MVYLQVCCTRELISFDISSLGAGHLQNRANSSYPKQSSLYLNSKAYLQVVLDADCHTYLIDERGSCKRGKRLSHHIVKLQTTKAIKIVIGIKHSVLWL